MEAFCCFAFLKTFLRVDNEKLLVDIRIYLAMFYFKVMVLFLVISPEIQSTPSSYLVNLIGSHHCVIRRVFLLVLMTPTEPSIYNH